ncbi:MAG: hypothetical protein LAN71_14985 [Acidobacteriia bacterium]|nr:hypothetical protein [Terriglobia bacterium]
MGINRIRLFALLAGLLLGGRLPAQQTPPDRFGGWSATAKAAPAAELPGGAEVLKEAGLVGAVSRTYAGNGHELKLTMYTMRDPSRAFAVYTWLRAPQMTDSDLAAFSAVGPDRALLLSGRVVVDASGTNAAASGDLRALVELLERAADHTPLPEIEAYLPLKGKIAGTERYAIGPAGFRSAMEAAGQPQLAPLGEKAGFASDAEAMVARYRSGAETVTLLLLEYPTPQLAGKHQKHIESTLAEIAGGTTSTVRRKGSLLAVVLPPAGTVAGQKALLDGVRYETNVTWNEAAARATDPPWPVIIVNTIIGTGVFISVAFICGIAFGGVRLLTKRFFPGKVFDRASDMQILQLALNSKAINSDDFYASWDPRGKS